MPLNTRGVLLTLPEAAKALGLTVATVRRYCNLPEPKLRGEKIGRDWHVTPKEVERFRREKRAVGRPIQPAV